MLQVQNHQNQISSIAQYPQARLPLHVGRQLPLNRPGDQRPHRATEPDPQTSGARQRSQGGSKHRKNWLVQPPGLRQRSGGAQMQNLFLNSAEPGKPLHWALPLQRVSGENSRKMLQKEPVTEDIPDEWRVLHRLSKLTMCCLQTQCSRYTCNYHRTAFDWGPGLHL